MFRVQMSMWMLERRGYVRRVDLTGEHLATIVTINCSNMLLIFTGHKIQSMVESVRSIGHTLLILMTFTP
jgi:hypothetical protein